MIDTTQLPPWPTLQTLSSDLLRYILRFSTSTDVYNCRQVCKAFAKDIPLDWTHELIHVTDDDSPPNFFPGKTRFTMLDDFAITPYWFAEKLVLNHFSSNGKLFVPSFFHALYDVNVMNIPNVEDIELSNPNLVEVTIFNGLKVTNVSIASSNIQSIYLARLSLDTFHIQPNWMHLRELCLLNVGRIRTFIIPAFCKKLEFVHMAGNQLERMEIHICRYLILKVDEHEPVTIVASNQTRKNIISYGLHRWMEFPTMKA